MILGFKVVDFFRNTVTVEIYNQLLKNQWLSAEVLKELQFINLKNLLNSCQQKCPIL